METKQKWVRDRFAWKFLIKIFAVADDGWTAGDYGNQQYNWENLFDFHAKSPRLKRPCLLQWSAHMCNHRSRTLVGTWMVFLCGASSRGEQASPLRRAFSTSVLSRWLGGRSVGHEYQCNTDRYENITKLVNSWPPHCHGSRTPGNPDSTTKQRNLSHQNAEKTRP